MCNVYIATGEVTQFEFDILLSGRIPWRLVRTYSSNNPHPGLIGFGWKLNLGTFLRGNGKTIGLIVDGEPVSTLPLPGIWNRIQAEESGFVVERTDITISAMDRIGTTYTFPCGGWLPQLMPCTVQRPLSLC
jgi:hypothetical protein